MAYRFKLNEPVQKAFRRIGLEQIERAEHELAAMGEPETAVHETRKCLKRIRALLRLVRPGLGESSFRAENARYKAIADLLSSTRDTHILLETTTKLENLPGQVSNAALAASKRVILDDLEQIRTAAATGVENALGKLASAKKRFRRLALEPATFATIERGLEQSFRSGEKALTRAYAKGSDEAFHDWRKTVQQHWRHMALVSRAWPDLFAARVSAARALSQILGDDHDLSILVMYVRSLPGDRLSALHAQEIERHARARQDVLRRSAEPRGRQLFVEGPRGHSRRVGLLWKAAEQSAAIEELAAESTAPEGELRQAGNLRT